MSQVNRSGFTFFDFTELSIYYRKGLTLNRLFCVTYCFHCRSPLKLPKFRYANLNELSPVTDLQLTGCVFRCIYALHLIAEGLTVCPFCESFFV